MCCGAATRHTTGCSPAVLLWCTMVVQVERPSLNLSECQQTTCALPTSQDASASCVCRAWHHLVCWDPASEYGSLQNVYCWVQLPPVLQGVHLKQDFKSDLRSLTFSQHSRKLKPSMTSFRHPTE